MKNQGLNGNVVKAGTNKYEVIGEKADVLVKVPKSSGPFMKLVQEHTMATRGGQVKIGPYWKNGLLLPAPNDWSGREGIILNRIFYDLEEGDLGHFIVAHIKIMRKTLEDGRVYIHLDIYKTPNQFPVFDLKFPTDSADGVPIPGSDAKIHFKPRRKREAEQEQG